ncbi:hypothetical protein C0J52_23186 [Blattella germanica]|nr:hypothetical protein C0J52_23186 [Blattella germanica]
MKAKEYLWKWPIRFSDCGIVKTRRTSEMEFIRKLGVIVHKQETESSEQDFPAPNDGFKLPRKVAKEFENFGLTWLHSIAPCFPLDGNKISIIHEPSTFYNTIMEKCRSAKRRITLASLYLGTGHLEEQLISAIGENLKDSKGQLKVKVLLDYTRGSRGEKNSRFMLLPLVSQYKDLCQVSLYHTPALRGPLRTIMPERYNEVIGLQHMKVYLFDDSLLISGANLSNDYFTNRQDRYVLIEDCGNLANFYDGLVSRVSEFSLQLKKNDEVHLHPDWEWHPYKGEKQGFECAARDRVWSYYSSRISQHENLGNRSVGRDLETQIAIVTKNPQLQQKLLEERERLYKLGTPFSNDTLSEPDRRNAPLWVHVAVRVFRGLL